MQLNVKNETSTLKAVVLGQPGSIGKVPTLEETYDAKSYESVLHNIYPHEEDIFKEMRCFESVLLKYGVQVYRPWTLENCNQVFARDVGFVIDDKIIVSNIIPNREDEKEAYEVVYNQIAYNKIFNLPEKAHVEGGDVVLYNNIVFVGLYTQPDYPQMKTARTNRYAFSFLKDKDGFMYPQDYHTLLDLFGRENVFEITREEMYYMNTNVFSISPEVVVSERNFIRLNTFMEEVWGMTVERVPYYEISKMGGLLRCSTLPLIREND